MHSLLCSSTLSAVLIVLPAEASSRFCRSMFCLAGVKDSAKEQILTRISAESMMMSFSDTLESREDCWLARIKSLYSEKKLN